MARQDRLRYLNDNERAALAEYLRRLRAEFGDQVLSVRLFGSKVRGDFDNDSDLDLFIRVRSDDWRLHRQMGRIGTDIEIAYGVLWSEILAGPARCAAMRQYREPLYNSVKREGVELWARKRPLSSMS